MKLVPIDFAGFKKSLEAKTESARFRHNFKSGSSVGGEIESDFQFHCQL